MTTIFDTNTVREFHYVNGKGQKITATLAFDPSNFERMVRHLVHKVGVGKTTTIGQGAIVVTSKVDG